MNPLLQRSTRQSLKSTAAMLRNMTPDKAKAQVESMVQSGQISQQQFESLKAKAQSICDLLGIK